MVESAAVEVVLYVSDGSPTCERAVALVSGLVAALDEASISLTIRNVSKEPLLAADKSVVLTPTLLVLHPRHIRVAGELDGLEVERVLMSVGARPPRPR